MKPNGKPSVGKGAFNISFIIAATIIEVLAALQLDGWLAWALWAIIARNAVVLVLILVGLLQMAVEQREAELRRAEVKVMGPRQGGPS